MVLIGALVYGVTRTNLTARLLALLAIPISLMMFVVSVYQRAVGSEMVWPATSGREAAGRYAIVPAMLLFSVAAVMIDRRSRRREGERRPRWLAWGLAALAVVVVAFSFHVEEPGSPRRPALGSLARTQRRSLRIRTAGSRNRRRHLPARLGPQHPLRRTGEVRQVGRCLPPERSTTRPGE